MAGHAFSIHVLFHAQRKLQVFNTKQNIRKKAWLQNYNKALDKIYLDRLKEAIGDFKMDNLQDENGKDIYGLIQESYNPIGLHVDAGFNLGTPR